MAFRISKTRFIVGSLALITVAWAGGAASFRTSSSNAAAAAPELPPATIRSDVVPGDNCPALTSWVVSPLQTSVGGWIDVKAAATDVDDGETIKYSWIPPGSFETPGQASTRYHCAAPGKQALLLQVSDDHSPMPCSTWFRIIVDCRPI